MTSPALHMIGRVLLRAFLLLLALCGAGAARAACSLASPSASFANGSSYDVRAGAVASVSVPASLSCSGSLISLYSGNYARATASSANGYKLSDGAGHTIGYRLSADSAGSYSFAGATGGTIDYFNSSLLALLGILNGANFVPTMYAAVTDTPNIPAGTYTDTVTVQWSWYICHGIGVGGICVGPEINSGTSVVTVSIIVSKDCRISAPALSFGSAPLASQFATVTQAVAIDCTRDAAYTIAFTSGASGASRPWRAMKDSSGNALQYNIYRPDGTTVWDQLNPLAAALPGTGATTPAQMQTYVAKINPDQTTPPAGHYTDTISVVVAF